MSEGILNFFINNFEGVSSYAIGMIKIHTYFSNEKAIKLIVQIKNMFPKLLLEN